MIWALERTGLSRGTRPLLLRAPFSFLLLTSVCYARLSLQPWVFRCARGTPHPNGDWGSYYARKLPEIESLVHGTF